MANHEKESCVELNFICLPFDEEKVVNCSVNKTLRDVIRQWFSKFYEHARNDCSVFWYDQMQFVQYESGASLSQIGFSNGNRVLFDFRGSELDHLSRRALLAGPTVETFQEALHHTEHFNQTGSTPAFITCVMSDDEFMRVMDVAIRNLPYDERFGGAKLMKDLMASADREYLLQRESANHWVDDVVKASHRGIDRASGIKSERFSNPDVGDRQISGRHLRLICNAAALHVAPMRYDRESFVELVKAGEIRIGEIRVDSSWQGTSHPIDVADDERSSEWEADEGPEPDEFGHDGCAGSE